MTAIELAGTHGGYEDFYGLVEPPFSLRPDPRFLFDSRAHSTAFDLVMEAFRRRETLIVITGEIGTGKTVLCRTILQRLPRRTFLSVITNPLLDGTDLLKQVLEDFGILSKHQEGVEAHTRHDLVRALERFLASLPQLQAHAVIMVDEAQHLQPEVLEQIRLLANFEADGHTPLQIVLVGQPNLADLLARPDMRQLEQRISHRCQLLPLEAAEVEQYIAHRLSVARIGPDGGRPDGPSAISFSPDAVRTITEASQGLPRVVNLLCDRAMEDAASRRKTVIDRQAALNAAGHLGIEIPQTPQRLPTRYLIAAAAIVAVALLGWIAVRALGLRMPWSTPAATSESSSSPASPGAPPPADPSAPEFAAAPPAEAAVPSPAPAPATTAAEAASATATLPEGEIFSVLVASFRTPTRAAAVSQQITALGLPAFIRMIPGDWRLVLVGPYASREETTAVQQRLDEARLTGSRGVTVGQTDPALASASQTGSVVTRAFLLPAFDRQAIVLDLGEDVTRAIALDSSSDRSVDVEIGSFQQGVAPMDYTPGTTSPVIDSVAVRPVREEGRMIARVTVKTKTAVTRTVRFSQRRVYIDLVPGTAPRSQPQEP